MRFVAGQMIRQAVILVGGRGTRLGQLTDDTPKPLLPVGGRPFVEYLLDLLAGQGIEQVLLSCGYRAAQFFSRYHGQSLGGARIECTDLETEPAGTGGALALLRECLDERFILLNGDSILRVDLQRLSKTLGTDPQRRLGALALTARPPGQARYGRVLLDKPDRVRGFLPPAEGPEGWINAGIYALHSSALAEIAAPSSLENDLLPALAEADMLGAAVFEGDFIDIGVPEDFERAQHLVPSMVSSPTDA